MKYGRAFLQIISSSINLFISEECIVPKDITADHRLPIISMPKIDNKSEGNSNAEEMVKVQ